MSEGNEDLKPAEELDTPEVNRAVDDEKINDGRYATERKRMLRDIKKLRAARNRALRREHAYEVILEMHGVDYSAVTDTALEGLEINGGAVVGEFQYKAPQIKTPSANKKKTETQAAPSLDEVKEWPTDKINSNWDMIKNLLKRNRK